MSIIVFMIEVWLSTIQGDNTEQYGSIPLAQVYQYQWKSVHTDVGHIYSCHIYHQDKNAISASLQIF